MIALEPATVPPHARHAHPSYLTAQLHLKLFLKHFDPAVLIVNVRVADENVVLEPGQIGHNRYSELGGVEVQQIQNSGGRITSTSAGDNRVPRASGCAADSLVSRAAARARYCNGAPMS